MSGERYIPVHVQAPTPTENPAREKDSLMMLVDLAGI